MGKVYTMFFLDLTILNIHCCSGGVTCSGLFALCLRKVYQYCPLTISIGTFSTEVFIISPPLKCNIRDPSTFQIDKIMSPITNSSASLVEDICLIHFLSNLNMEVNAVNYNL